MRIAFYGSSLLSSYWNGAATYYRGIIRALSLLGHEITFLEPDIYERQQHRDIDPPDWCRVVVYAGTDDGIREACAHAQDADAVVVTSGIGYADDTIRRLAYGNAGPGAIRVYWDVDAPATLAAVAADQDHPLRHDLAAHVDLVLTYGGGDPVVYGYRGAGARECVPVYNALDATTHHPVPPKARFGADLAFLGNRLPDREGRVEEFLLRPASLLRDKSFLLGGSGWGDKPLPANVHLVGHVATGDHNAFNCSPLAILNISRQDMATNGFSPATRVFEAAGAGACIVTDFWAGIEMFLEPGQEVLVARDGRDVADILCELTPAKAREIGARALRRIRAQHTYDKRATLVDRLLRQARGSGLEAAE